MFCFSSMELVSLSNCVFLFATEYTEFFCEFRQPGKITSILTGFLMFSSLIANSMHQYTPFNWERQNMSPNYLQCFTILFFLQSLVLLDLSYFTLIWLTGSSYSKVLLIFYITLWLFLVFLLHSRYTTVLWLHSEENNLVYFASFSLKTFAVFVFMVNLKHRIFNTLKQKEIEIKKSREK